MRQGAWRGCQVLRPRLPLLARHETRYTWIRGTRALSLSLSLKSTRALLLFRAFPIVHHPTPPHPTGRVRQIRWTSHHCKSTCSSRRSPTTLPQSLAAETMDGAHCSQKVAPTALFLSCHPCDSFLLLLSLCGHSMKFPLLVVVNTAPRSLTVSRVPPRAHLTTHASSHQWSRTARGAF